MTLIFTLILLAFGVILIHFVWFVTWLVAHFRHRKIGYLTCGIVSALFVLIVWFIMAYGYFVGRFQFEVKSIVYENSDLPKSFSGYRIVHISDLHLATFADRPRRLQLLVDSINALHPDVVCFTGDLVSLGADEAIQFKENLRSLTSADGVVAVLGNHDMGIYQNLENDSLRLLEEKRVEAFERDSLGWQLLRNQHVTVRRGRETLTFVGVDNSSCGTQGFKQIYTGDLLAALEGTHGFRILLSHDPTHWRAEVVGQCDVPLTLSGHTHAMQFRLFGWSPAALIFPDVEGRIDCDQQTLYINAGLGCTLPVRLSCPAEITLIELKKR